MAMKTMGTHASTYFHIAGSFPHWLSRTVRLNQPILLAFLPERAYISMGFQAFLAENLLCVRQPLTLLGFRQGVIKKGIKHRCCFGL